MVKQKEKDQSGDETAALDLLKQLSHLQTDWPRTSTVLGHSQPPDLLFGVCLMTEL